MNLSPAVLDISKMIVRFCLKIGHKIVVSLNIVLRLALDHL